MNRLGPEILHVRILGGKGGPHNPKTLSSRCDFSTSSPRSFRILGNRGPGTVCFCWSFGASLCLACFAHFPRFARSARSARLLSLALRSRSWRTTHTRTHFFFLLTAASCEPGCWQNCIACTGQNEQAQASNQKVSKPFARHQEALTTALGQENKAQRLLLITHG